jgi:hypothetical protein
MALFETLGFQWDRDSVPREVPCTSPERALFRFHRMLPEYVWDAGVKPAFCSIHSLVARDEALEWGHFRGEGLETQFTPEVALGELGRFTPLATEPGAIRLNEVFANGIR